MTGVVHSRSGTGASPSLRSGQRSRIPPVLERRASSADRVPIGAYTRPLSLSLELDSCRRSSIVHDWLRTKIYTMASGVQNDNTALQPRIHVDTRYFPPADLALPALAVQTTRLVDTYMLWVGTTDVDQEQIENAPLQGCLAKDWACAMPAKETVRWAAPYVLWRRGFEVFVLIESTEHSCIRSQSQARLLRRRRCIAPQAQRPRYPWHSVLVIFSALLLA